MERLQGIASALGQAYAKQKLQTEEILQLVERGVPVWGMLEKITGKNAAQLSKLASEGRLGRDVIAALTKEIGASAEGAAAPGQAQHQVADFVAVDCADIWAHSSDASDKNPLYWLRGIDCADRLAPVQARAEAKRHTDDSWQDAFRRGILLEIGRAHV